MGNKWIVMFFTCILVVATLCSCAPAATPAPTPEPIAYKCSMVVESGDGWDNVRYGLGQFDKYLVNGKLRSYGSGILQPKDVVSSVSPAENCTGTLNLAQIVTFTTQTGDLVYDITGFQDSIASQFEDTLKYACLARNTKLNQGHDKNDLSSGCNFYTGIRFSTMTGETKCEEFTSITSLYNDFVPTDQMMSFSILVTTTTSDLPSPNICSTRPAR